MRGRERGRVRGRERRRESGSVLALQGVRGIYMYLIDAFFDPTIGDAGKPYSQTHEVLLSTTVGV